MPKKYNINMDAIQKTVESFKQDQSRSRKTNKIEGTWNLKEGMPQFSADIVVDGNKFTLESDQPSMLGGAATRPGPLHYCLYGSASCFTASFVTTAAMEGLPLDEVKTIAESDINFSKVFGLSDEPIVDAVRITLQVKSPASSEEIDRVLKLSEEMCPAVYCLTKPIPLKTRAEKL